MDFLLKTRLLLKQSEKWTTKKKKIIMVSYLKIHKNIKCWHNSDDEEKSKFGLVNIENKQTSSIGIVCLVTLKIGETIPKKSTGCQIFFLFIFILKTN